MSGEARLDVRSRDGTSLAVWADGDGPPLVLVRGSMQDHTASRTLVDELVGDFRTFAMDRRGFGASRDAGSWALAREFEDVAAVIEVVAAEAGEDVAVWGHSFGARRSDGWSAR